MIAMDSGNGHLAANYGIPVLTLWGATHPSLGFMPYGQGPERQLYADRGQYPELPTSVYGNKLPQDYTELMRSIPVSDILSKVTQILA
jgi:ADP-heptose:LPS heptosyltransferase